MDQGNHQSLQHCPCLLQWDAADEVGTRHFKKGHHPGQSCRREPYVGVQKEEQVVRGNIGQDPTGVLFATPAFGQLWPVQKPHAGVAVGKPAHDGGCRVVGLVVEYQHLQCDRFARQRRRHAGLDRLFFITCGNQHGYARKRAAAAGHGWRLIGGQV